ncbi:hypothetical protein A8E63_17720 [Burkholderia cenocepacia]|nr:hypothetical protein A8E04_17730 [Burkholderia cenocepacia]ONU86766.1 hypothetical protein A8E63_17720 [Burkholderia cenocepacia]
MSHAAPLRRRPTAAPAESSPAASRSRFRRAAPADAGQTDARCPTHACRAANDAVTRGMPLAHSPHRTASRMPGIVGRGIESC